jgi:hypothetical protein
MTKLKMNDKYRCVGNQIDLQIIMFWNIKYTAGLYPKKCELLEIQQLETFMGLGLPYGFLYVTEFIYLCEWVNTFWQ